jgi:hypothetical protein
MRTSGALVQPPREQVPRKRRADSQPPAGPSPELVHPETAEEILQDPSSTTRSTKPDQESWDFSEDEQDFGEKKNPPKPHDNS